MAFRGGRQGVDAALQSHRLLRGIRTRGIGGRNPDHNPGPALGNMRYHRSARDHHGRMAVATVHRWPRRRLCLAWHSLSIPAVSLGGRHQPSVRFRRSVFLGRVLDNSLSRYVATVSFGVYIWQDIVLTLMTTLFPWTFGTGSDDVQGMDHVQPRRDRHYFRDRHHQLLFSWNAPSCVGPAAASRRDGCRPHPTKSRPTETVGRQIRRETKLDQGGRASCQMRVAFRRSSSRTTPRPGDSPKSSQPSSCLSGIAIG